MADAAATRFVRRRDVLDASLGGGETVLLHQVRGQYFGLKGVAQRIWELLESPLTLDEVCTALTEVFEIDEDACRRDTQEFIAELVREGLIDVVDQQPSQN